MDSGRTYSGVILPALDMLNRGRYKVHIKELHSHLDPLIDGIWCGNKTHANKYNTDSVLGSYGSYFPIMPGTRVKVVFGDGNFEKGDIVAIAADQEEFALPLYCTPEARDLVTTIFKTPIYSNMLQINEFGTVPSATGQPKNSMHLYFNTDLPDVKFGGKNDPDTAPETNKRTVLIINEDGIHWWTADNQYVTVDLDANICINKNVKIKVGENADVHIKGSTKLHVDGQTDLYFDGVLNIKSDATINIQGGPNINLNCGTSAAQAEDNKGYNEKPGADKELTGISRVGDMALAAAKIGKKLK